MRLTKQHGCGNDYLYLDGFATAMPSEAELIALAQRASDRHTGVGADGLIAVLPPTQPGADFRMRMWNADGSESEMCGNGLRCAAKLAVDRRHVTGPQLVAETGAGLLAVAVETGGDGLVVMATVDLGRPRLQAHEVPVLGATDLGEGRLNIDLSAVQAGLHGLAVGMGNPHCVILVDDAEAVDLAGLGPRLEHHPAFPRRSNIEFISRLPAAAAADLRQRTWERGSGITLACGTGAAASAVAAILAGWLPHGLVRIRLDGGLLELTWSNREASVLLRGEAVHICEVDWPDRQP